MVILSLCYVLQGDIDFIYILLFYFLKQETCEIIEDNGRQTANFGYSHQISYAIASSNSGYSAQVFDKKSKRVDWKKHTGRICNIFKAEKEFR